MELKNVAFSFLVKRSVLADHPWARGMHNTAHVGRIHFSPHVFIPPECGDGFLLVMSQPCEEHLVCSYYLVELQTAVC